MLSWSKHALVKVVIVCSALRLVESSHKLSMWELANDALEWSWHEVILIVLEHDALSNINWTDISHWLCIIQDFAQCCANSVALMDLLCWSAQCKHYAVVICHQFSKTSPVANIMKTSICAHLNVQASRFCSSDNVSELWMSSWFWELSD